MGYLNLFWNELNYFWDMGYFGWFILGYGILPTPLTKPHNPN